MPINSRAKGARGERDGADQNLLRPARMTPTQLLDRQERILAKLEAIETDLRDNSEQLAAAIRQARDARGLTNHDIAKHAGLPYTSVVNWVYGNVMLPEKAAKKILKLFAQKRGPKPRA